MTKEDSTLRDSRGRIIALDSRVRVSYPEDHRMFDIQFQGYVLEIKQDERHGPVLIIEDKITGFERTVPAKFARRMYDRKAVRRRRAKTK